MTIYWHDIIGTLGVAGILITYLMAQLGKMQVDHLTYPVVNAIGAAFVLVSLLYEFNLYAMVIEVFWFLISVVGIHHALKVRHQERQQTAQQS